MSRKLFPIDETALINYARLGASNREIADIFGCDEGTVRKRFAPQLAKARAERRAKLRGYQWELAKKGNATMLIWLGKNELKQSDNPGLAPDDDPEPELDPKVG